MVAATIFGLFAVAVGAQFRGALGAAAGALALQVLQALLFAYKAIRSPRRLPVTQVLVEVPDSSFDAQ